MKPQHQKVAVIAFDRLTVFEFGIAVEVFGLPRPDLDPWYSFSVCGIEPGPIRALGGLTIAAKKGIRALDSAGTIVVPGWRDVNERPPTALLRALCRANQRRARILSLCSGAFVLAEAGLLDGRRATTHWRYAEQLTTSYPSIDVDPNVLYVDDGDILTAAGSAAGIDLCLHLVRRDFGADMANRVARRLVVPPHRDGGQAQFIDRPLTECDATGLARLLEWLTDHLDQEHTISTMAKSASMSERTFARRFKDQTGTMPSKWLANARVQRAQQLLESTDLGVDQLAFDCGFGSAQLLRFHFQRIAGTTPTAYRNSFRGRSVP